MQMNAGIILAGKDPTDLVINGQRMQANADAMRRGDQAEKEANAGKLARMVLSSADPAGAYKHALAAAGKMGLDVSGFPGEYSPEVGESLKAIVAATSMGKDARTDLERKLALIDDPEERKRAARIALKLEPPATREGPPKRHSVGGNLVDNDGNVVYRGEKKETKPLTGIARLEDDFKNNRIDEATFRAAKRKLLASGNNVTVETRPDGTTVTTVGGKDKSGLERSTKTGIQKDIASGEEILSRFKRLGEVAGIDSTTGKLSPEGQKMFTLAGRVNETVTNWQDYLDLPDWVPVIGGKPAPEAIAFLKKRKTMSTSAAQLFNEYRKDITGAAAAIAELNRLEKAFVNEKMGPSEFEAVYTETVEMLTRIRDVRVELLQRGIDPKTPAGGAALDAVLGGADINSVAPSGANAGTPEAPQGGKKDPEARFRELLGSGKSEAEAYEELIREGY